MIKRLSILLTITCCVMTVVAGVIPDMKFKRIDTREGLSNSTVNTIIRDSRGYMWFGTGYGLNRYDGYRMRTFFSYDKDTTSLRNNRIDQIQEGFSGILWLNQGMNYSVYNPETEKVDRTPSRSLNKKGIKGTIESIHIDSRKNYWVKTYEDGFYYYNQESNKVTHIPFGYGKKEFPKEFGVSAYTESKEGMILVSTFGELMCINGERGMIIWKEDYVKQALDAYNDYWVAVDRDDNIWVITHTTGTYIYVRQEKRWYTSLSELMRAQGYQDVPDNIFVWEICYDAKGFLWVATDHMGVLVLDPKTKEWRQFTNVKGDETSLPDITAKHLYLDQLGRMWIATYKNGVAMCSESMTNFVSLAVGDINAITEDKDGYYWLGRNDGGIIKMDPKTLEPVDTFLKRRLGVPSDIIVGSYASRDGSLWFGTYEGGLLQYKNGEWKNYRTTDPGSAMVTNNIWGITEDRWGNIWLGVLGGGAVRIDKRTGKQRAFLADNSALKTVWTNSISTASNGWIMLGNSEYFALIHPGNFRIINGWLAETKGAKAITVSTSTSHAVMDSRRLIWLCSPAGVAIFDRKHNTTTLLDMKSGLYGSNAVAVTEDTRHTMWVATDHGVSNIIPQMEEDSTWTFIVRSYNDRDGLQSGPFNQRAIYCSRDGNLLIGGQDGLDVISTLRLGEDHGKENPVFSGLVLFDQLVEVGEEMNGRVILDKALNIQRSFTLKYAENQFTVQMASDDGGVNNKTRFVYRLKGFNDNWIKTPNGDADITYMGLSPGSYTLCVRILHDDGTMGEMESELSITILAPWYRSWWAWICYVLLAILLLLERKHIVRFFCHLKAHTGKQHPQEQAAEMAQDAEDEVEEAVLMEEE